MGEWQRSDRGVEGERPESDRGAIRERSGQDLIDKQEFLRDNRISPDAQGTVTSTVDRVVVGSSPTFRIRRSRAEQQWSGFAPFRTSAGI